MVLPNLTADRLGKIIARAVNQTLAPCFKRVASGIVLAGVLAGGGRGLHAADPLVLGTPVKINATACPRAGLPALATGGNQFAVCTVESGHSLMLRKFDSTGALQGAAMTVSPSNAFSPAVEMTDDGSIAVIWLQGASLNFSGLKDLMYMRYDAAGTAGTPVTIATGEFNSGTEMSPQLAFDKTDAASPEYLACISYQLFNISGKHSLFLQRLTNDQKVDAVETVSEDLRVISQHDLAIGVKSGFQTTIALGYVKSDLQGEIATVPYATDGVQKTVKTGVQFLPTAATGQSAVHLEKYNQPGAGLGLFATNNTTGTSTPVPSQPDVDRIQAPELGGNFAFLSSGVFQYSADTSPLDAPTYFYIFSGNSDLEEDFNRIGVYLQDDWEITSDVTLNLGTRFDSGNGIFVDDTDDTRSDASSVKIPEARSVLAPLRFQALDNGDGVLLTCTDSADKTSYDVFVRLVDIPATAVPPGGATLLDGDGDGFSDEVEFSLGSNPYSNTSRPFDQPSGFVQAVNDGATVSVTLNFKKPLSDKWQVQVALKTPDNADRTLIVDFAGSILSGEVDEKGNLKTETSSSSVKVKKPKIEGAFTDVKIKAVIQKSDLAALFADEGLTDETVKNKTVNIPVFIHALNKSYTLLVPATYTGKAGSSGKAKGALKLK